MLREVYFEAVETICKEANVPELVDVVKDIYALCEGDETTTTPIDVGNLDAEQKRTIAADLVKSAEADEQEEQKEQQAETQEQMRDGELAKEITAIASDEQNNGTVSTNG